MTAQQTYFDTALRPSTPLSSTESPPPPYYEYTVHETPSHPTSSVKDDDDDSRYGFWGERDQERQSTDAALPHYFKGACRCTFDNRQVPGPQVWRYIDARDECLTEGVTLLAKSTGYWKIRPDNDVLFGDEMSWMSSYDGSDSDVSIEDKICL
ncbi:hypothetical protein GQ44DRAFT_727805 [Phaeosphaeriaceae sp. PMI808]|nr:hypothetical protein GQ44DRAFT_727805 [Phaeosphaeriaceae sp. PMI808]